MILEIFYFKVLTVETSTTKQLLAMVAYILPLIALYTAIISAEQEEWGAIKTKTITKLDGTMITTKFAQFVEVNYGLTSSSTLILKADSVTKDACGAQCINSRQRCLFYRMEFYDSTRVRGDCWLYSHLAKAVENKYSYWYLNPLHNPGETRRAYEIKVRISKEMIIR